MSDEPALLKAIFAHPEEDTPRLVFADWLEEQGGASNIARAEYIRLEIEHARDFPEMRWSKTKADAQKRARELFAKYYSEWFPELYGRKNILRGARGRPDMHRGFPYRLLAQSDKLLEIGERLMALAPITEVEFRDVTDWTVEQFVKAPWVRGIRELNLTGYDIPPTNWAPLADCPYLTEVVDLCPYAGRLDPAGAARIADANPFPKLQRFSLGFRSTDEVLAKLFGGKTFTGLRELRLSGSRDNYGIAGLRAVASSRALASLKVFELPWRPMKDMISVLTKAPFWSGLEELDLLRNNLTDDDLAKIIRKPSALRVLALDDNKITAAGAKKLAASSLCANLTKLDLSRNGIGDKGIAALVGSPNARNLRVLDVSSCKFGLAGFTAIAESPHLANLRELIVYGNDFELKAARALIASPHLAGLNYLSASASGTARKELKARFGDRVSL